MQFETILRELGLVRPKASPDEVGPARRFHYRPTPRPRKRLNRLSRPCTVQYHPGREADWEAFYAALWSTSMEAIAGSARLSLRAIARALDQPSPFAPRRDW